MVKPEKVLDVDCLHLTGLAPDEKSQFLRLWALRIDVARGNRMQADLDDAERRWEERWMP